MSSGFGEASQTKKKKNLLSFFFSFFIYDVDNYGHSNNKRNTNATDLYPGVVLRSRFHVKMFDGGRSPCHVENY